MTFRNPEAAGSGRVLTIGGGTDAYTGFFSGTITLAPGASVTFDDPDSVGSGVGAVTGGSSKLIQFDPGGTAGTAEIIVGGDSAVS